MEHDGLYTKGRYMYPGFFENHIARDFIIALTALCRLEQKEEYMKLLQGFVSHPNKIIALMADVYWKKITGPEERNERE